MVITTAQYNGTISRLASLVTASITAASENGIRCFAKSVSAYLSTYKMFLLVEYFSYISNPSSLPTLLSCRSFSLSFLSVSTIVASAMPSNETSPLLARAESNIRYDNYINDQAPLVVNGSATQDAESGDDSGDAPEQDPDVPTISGVNIAAVVPAMSIGIFLASMDNTIVVASYGRIGTELNELNRTSWLSTAYVAFQ